MITIKRLVLTIVASLYITTLLSAETIILKSGKSIEGKIVKETDEYINVEFQGLSITLYREEIERIEKPFTLSDERLQELVQKFLPQTSYQQTNKTPNNTLPTQTEDFELKIIKPGTQNIDFNQESKQETSLIGESNKTLNQKDWIKNHHGVIIFDKPTLSGKYDYFELVRLAKELGTDIIKTWLTGNIPGEIPQKAKSKDYGAVFDAFKVICLNVCPDYMKLRWDTEGVYSTNTRNDVKSDYYQLTKFLIEKYNGSGKTFIISYFFELDLYFGTRNSGRQNFPVLTFIADAQTGVKRALKESPVKNIRILDCIESSIGLNAFEFIKEIFPKVKVDLYSGTFYAGDLKPRLDFWAKYAPDNNIFGSKNIIIGEYGKKIDPKIKDSDERSQSLTLASIRKDAKEWGVPFMFLFCLADQYPQGIDDSWGIVDVNRRKRKAWLDLSEVYR